MAAHELMVHSAAHAMVHSSGATFLLGEGESGDKRKRHSRQQRIFTILDFTVSSWFSTSCRALDY